MFTITIRQCYLGDHQSRWVWPIWHCRSWAHWLMRNKFSLSTAWTMVHRFLSPIVRYWYIKAHFPCVSHNVTGYTYILFQFIFRYVDYLTQWLFAELALRSEEGSLPDWASVWLDNDIVRCTRDLFMYVLIGLNAITKNPFYFFTHLLASSPRTAEDGETGEIVVITNTEI